MLLLCPAPCYGPVAAVWAAACGNTINMTDNNPPVSGDGWSYSDDVYTILDGANVTVTGGNQSLSSSRRRIAVAADATAAIVLDGVSITDLGGYQSPLTLNDGANVTLILAGTNTLMAGSFAAGIQTTGATLTIDGTGKLEAAGGGWGAGIGGGNGGSGGNITISGGTISAVGISGGAGIGGGDSVNDNCIIAISGGMVSAKGGVDGAGIGGGDGGDGGVITISGGTVSSMGGQFGAGIGGGDMGGGGAITISGGTVIAVGGQYGAGIGGGAGGGGIITISGGVFTVISEDSDGSITIRGGAVTVSGKDGAALTGLATGISSVITLPDAYTYWASIDPNFIPAPDDAGTTVPGGIPFDNSGSPKPKYVKIETKDANSFQFPVDSFQ